MEWLPGGFGPPVRSLERMSSDAFKTCGASNTVPVNSLKEEAQGCGAGWQVGVVSALPSVKITFGWEEETDATHRSSWWPKEVPELSAGTVSSPHLSLFP